MRYRFRETLALILLSCMLFVCGCGAKEVQQAEDSAESADAFTGEMTENADAFTGEMTENADVLAEEEAESVDALAEDETDDISASDADNSVVTQQYPVYEIAVNPIDQHAEGAGYGCEAACLLMGLWHKGHATEFPNLMSFVAIMPLSSTNNPNTGFAGSPYELEYGVYQSIFPEAIVAWGNQYGTCVNMSGQSADALVEQVKQDNTVLFFTTFMYEEPVYDTYNYEGVDHTLIDNAHVVLLIGYDQNRNMVKVADPSCSAAGYSPTYWLKYEAFERTYNYMKFAVAITG